MNCAKSNFTLILLEVILTFWQSIDRCGISVLVGTLGVEGLDFEFKAVLTGFVFPGLQNGINESASAKWKCNFQLNRKRSKECY